MNQTPAYMRKLGPLFGVGLAALALAGCGATNASTTAGSADTVSASPLGGSGSTAAGTTGSTGSGSGSDSGAATGSKACTTADLSLKVFEGPGDGTSTVGAYIVLTNTSDSTCTTHGYPGVDFFNGQTDLREQTTRAVAGFATTVTLAPNGQATSYFTYTGPIPAGACDHRADTVQVIPPNQTTALRSGIDHVGGSGGSSSSNQGFSVCDGGINVSPLSGGYNGPH